MNASESNSHEGFAVASRDEHLAVTTSRTPMLTQYLMMAVRRKWTIVGAIVVCLAAAILITLLATPKYTAVTQIEINREGARILNNVENVEPETSTADQEFYQTQYTILESRAMADRVVRKLRLADNQQFFETMRASTIADSFTNGRSSLSRAAREDAAAHILTANVSVEGIRTSRLVNIEWTSPEPTLSAQVASTWGTSFIEYNLERRYDATAYARTFLEGRLVQLRQRLEQSERQLVSYAQNQAIVSLPIGASDASGKVAERSLTVDRLGALNTALSEATADRIRAESRIEGSRSSASSEQLSNPTINSLRQRRAELSADYARLMTQFSPDYPPAKALSAQLSAINTSLSREESRVTGGLQNVYRDAQQRENLLQKQVDALRVQFLDQRRSGIQYNIFQREVDTNRQLYDGLLQRLKEIGVAAGSSENNISVIDTAQVPTRPSYPRPLLNLLAGLGLGILSGLALAFAREQIDETIADPADFERRIGLPMLGGVPNVRSAHPLEDLRDPKSGLTEAYLSIQASLLFSTDHGLPRSLAVTSTRPAEGKSTTAHAFAYVIGRSGSRTLLIDADMRSPSLHADLSIPNEIGLSAVLSGLVDVGEAINKVDGLSFDVMTAGKSPPNAAELLRGHLFTDLLRQLGERYDCVVIDCPPVMGLADAPIIASVAESTVFVMEARGIKARLALIAIDRLHQARARLTGAVMTKLPLNNGGYGYGYDYGYGYGRRTDD
ncbi:Exopolysaccharide biosynthesis protein [Sphingomonas sp. T1]|jgi:succinoglycan biosynthesis transport protein ExoP|uniref:GumC family protein n=1 Tax=Sphingomonas sp. T1 TaxID=2653172 RepID=UPI0012F1AC5A|nr:polysaccharide biosynthesis tyrosine autokinase [Sphingomonas sp. T1]VXD06187.1 Exopolysaccharide biosynthesis protein [Sphingomonas sp. T1]